MIVLLYLGKPSHGPVYQLPAYERSIPGHSLWDCGEQTTQVQGVSRLLKICPVSIILPMLNNDLIPLSPTLYNLSN
jgi:hypothetical protein